MLNKEIILSDILVEVTDSIKNINKFIDLYNKYDENSIKISISHIPRNNSIKLCICISSMYNYSYILHFTFKEACYGILRMLLLYKDHLNDCKKDTITIDNINDINIKFHLIKNIDKMYNRYRLLNSSFIRNIYTIFNNSEIEITTLPKDFYPTLLEHLACLNIELKYMQKEIISIINTL